MASALTLLGIALALAPLGLEAVGYELSSEQGYGILVLAALFFLGAVIVLFWPWLKEVKRLKIGFAPPDTELRKAKEAQQRLSTQLKQIHKELTFIKEANERVRGKLREAEQELEEHRRENKELTANKTVLENEKRQNLQDHRRKHIDEWRSVIQDFDFDTERFAGTNTYSQMKPHLQTGVIEMFETPRMLYVGNDARGDSAYKYTLLDEVTRIEREREWDLI